VVAAPTISRIRQALPTDPISSTSWQSYHSLPPPQGNEAVVNQAAMDLLRKLPGVTDANHRALMTAFGSLRGLADAPLDRLQQVMGGERSARMLREFLDAPCPRL